MKGAILMMGIAGIFIFGYMMMGKLDNFLGENRRAIEKESERKEPACMMLSKDMSDEEMTREIRAFRSKHENMRIMLYGHIAPEEPAGKSGCFGRKT